MVTDRKSVSLVSARVDKTVGVQKNKILDGGKLDGKFTSNIDSNNI